MRRPRRYALVSFVLVISLVDVGSARVVNPRDTPSFDGPLTFAGRDCDKVVGRSSTGEVGVVSKSCVFAFRFDPNEETDVARNYGILWYQSWADPRNGWCTRKVTSDLIVSEAKILARAPSRSVTVRRARSFETRIATTAGASGRRARVWRPFTVQPGRLRPAVRENGMVSRLIWSGATRHTTSFAIGIEASWGATSDRSVGLDGRIVSDLTRSC